MCIFLKYAKRRRSFCLFSHVGVHGSPRLFANGMKSCCCQDCPSPATTTFFGDGRSMASYCSRGTSIVRIYHLVMTNIAMGNPL